MREWRTLPVAGRLFESARWLEAEQCFQWVDILTARIFRWSPVTDAVESLDLGFDFLTLATPSQQAGVQIIASRDSLYTYHWGEDPKPLAVLAVGPEARLNDGIVDSTGHVWIGSMGLASDRSKPLGKLWRIGPGGSAVEMLRGLGISNGIAWANATTGFHVDSLAGALYSVSHDGTTLGRELALQFADTVEPDGILLADDILWIALWEGGALGRFDTLTGHYCEVTVPASRPSSLAMSSQHVLVTTAGRGTGSDLDLSGLVIVSPIGALTVDGHAAPEHGMVMS